ncbi:hypothetical protein CYMTET_13592 [Cymbomonas tetramitiformis]|uniref:C-CAP/cofactor C-like domain-containing protein n=1 Tax=Cymbomonas tetramitiformis TaxID=36881 RepID=A0AAE0GHT1_9CHLO|nr:hypothetical protein CYMTET_13592 [Cymbomonas tetramitiformis]
MAPLLVLRREAFEFGLLPASQFFARIESPTAVLALQKQLLTGSYSQPSACLPDQRLISPSTIASCLNIPEKHASIVVDTLNSILPPELTDDATAEQEGVDVHLLSLFLFLQTYTRPGTHQRRATGEGWPDSHNAFSAIGTYGDVPSSPTKASLSISAARHKGSHASDDAAQLAYMLKHLETMLVLIKDGESFTGPLQASRFDRLAMLLQRAPGAASSTGSLSLLVPLFQTGAGMASVSAVQDWLTRQMGAAPLPTRLTVSGAAQPEQSSSASTRGLDVVIGGSPASSNTSPGALPLRRSQGKKRKACRRPGFSWERVEDGCSACSPISPQVLLEGVRKQTGIAARVGDGQHAQRTRGGLPDAVLYFLAPMKHVAITGCMDCTIVLGAVGGVLKLELCERVNVVAAAQRTSIVTCRDSTLCLAASQRPLVLGDCRHVQLAPYNSHYDRLEAHLRVAGISPTRNHWDEPINMTRKPTTAEGSPSVTNSRSAGSEVPDKLAVSLLPPEKFMPFMVPFRMPPESGASEAEASRGGTHTNPFPVPQTYNLALESKVHAVQEMRQAVAHAALDELRKKELQTAIQAYFKEWLVASGNMRQVFDLAHMERHET